MDAHEPPHAPVSRRLLAAMTVFLFALWSNSFIANSYLLGTDGGAKRLDWLSLTAARFLVAGALAGLYCLIFERSAAAELWRRERTRLAACGVIGGPLYNFALCSAQQRGVPAPIASVTTALAPLFIMVLSAAFLGESMTRRRGAGFVVAVAGLGVIASAKKEGLEVAYPLWIGVAALAPLAWSVYSIVSKPRMRRWSPLLWTYLGTAIGGATVTPLLALPRVRADLRALDAAGWLGVLYLAVPCTVVGFAVWTWLLRHLPASTVGLTVFLNPPMTTASKALLAIGLPSVFAFTISGREWAGGAIALAGLALAIGGATPVAADRIGSGARRGS